LAYLFSNPVKLNVHDGTEGGPLVRACNTHFFAS
jgi:hypothetical protein